MLSYIGGKMRMADWISSYVPPCETYVEVLGGAYWVYVNSDIHTRCDKAVYNDFNPYMTNLFKCVSTPKVLSKYIDSKEIPLQEKGKPELSQSCYNYFDCKGVTYQKTSGLFYLFREESMLANDHGGYDKYFGYLRNF